MHGTLSALGVSSRLIVEAIEFGKVDITCQGNDLELGWRAFLSKDKILSIEAKVDHVLKGVVALYEHFVDLAAELEGEDDDCDDAPLLSIVHDCLLGCHHEHILEKRPGFLASE